MDKKKEGFILFYTLLTSLFGVLALIYVTVVYRAILILMLNHNEKEEAFELAQVEMVTLAEKTHYGFHGQEQFKRKNFEVEIAATNMGSGELRTLTVTVRVPNREVPVVNLVRYE
ncbi:MAG TPA: hypothetical protein IAB06_05755 [Candidatus Avacidaminococcus intestinavium]|uniref:Uncharacterized protein n=1 Tax=Candidatus Avacidaminococcus intestinavium TaxID=2840684 RepID=A0A9D1MQM4_9FIRM|nr:hypothetical protein [Candidatus Avacidaminococcus intestinavium]